MLQHILLIFPAAALFLSGLPAWVVRPVTGQAFLRRPLRIATSPLTCGLLYILVISVWHVPRLYDWALQVKVVHVWEHVMFFAAALAYWWPVLSPSTEFPPCKPGTQMLYQLGIIIGMTPLFAFITFSSDVLYPTYEYAPRLLAGLGPLDDQVLAGVGMKLTGMAVALGVIAVAFYRWFKEDAAAKP
jgi:putative membrane protein